MMWRHDAASIERARLNALQLLKCGNTHASEHGFGSDGLRRVSAEIRDGRPRLSSRPSLLEIGVDRGAATVRDCARARSGTSLLVGLDGTSTREVFLPIASPPDFWRLAVDVCGFTRSLDRLVV